MIHIDDPIHGAVLNHRHGRQDQRSLTIRVSGRAPQGARVLVNGHEAARAGETFAADVRLTEAWSDITATLQGPHGAATHAVRVLWDRWSRKRYRFSIDDNSFFLRDLARNRPASIFDCFYLDGLRRLHREYGAKFSLNLFHTTPENDFALTDFPDTYKAEWREHGSWLKLAFHADSEFPDRPYEYAAPARLAHDLDLVAGEIQRFAGAEAYALPTVLHWGMCPPACLPVLRERGVRVLSGMFRPGANGRYDVNYNLDATRSEHLERHDALVDLESGITFSMIDIICNSTKVADTVPRLSAAAALPDTAEVMDLFTHEQYFWPFYHNYVPDHFERLEAAIRFVTEAGYEPVFFHEGFLGGADPAAVSA
jgi:hypothetical protein